ncbi:clusterin-associated protein 1 [Diachasma alloeum]|uniref:clusterin-associated protein 1 n=1 Tax=Diachasma alloeum TaxID=454923 RepID=UPI0007382D74|nr:clusterin-associated protein 1 [Diachasma alloeum]
MSFRDLRNFTEIMRFLGYPRLISLSNFRVPNFPLVAEILVWLVRRFDPDTDIPIDHHTEEDRVAIIRRAAEFMAIKTNIKLNTKKLYQADGYAVHELLKVATLLYGAQSNSAEEEILSSDNKHQVKIDISDRLNELKNTRQLASQLTVNGASLFDLLGREVQLREIRNLKVARQFDTAEIELAMREVIENAKKEIEETRNQIENVKETEKNLEGRINRRKTELERNQTRLQSLRKVRPAFMEEFEKLEVELRVVYDDYIQKCRYLSYLEHLYEDATKIEQERFEKRQAATKRQLEQLRGEDASFESMMESNDSIIPTNLGGPLEETEKRGIDNTGQLSRTVQPETTGRASSRVPIPQRKIYGSMSGRPRGAVKETIDSVGSLDSDSDLLIDGDDLDDDDDDLEDEILNPVNPREIAGFDLKSGEKRDVGKNEHSDEDF